MDVKLALFDVIEGAKNYEFWTTFGMNDMQAKYRGSKLGRIWIILSVSIFIFVIGGLYRGILNADYDFYMAHLAVGYIMWLFIQQSIVRGSKVLEQSREFLLQNPWPVSMFFYRLIYRELLFMGHHMILLIFIFVWLGLYPGIYELFFACLGLVLLIFCMFWTSLLIGIISLRYSDVKPIIGSMMRMLFFATPIIWVDRQVGEFAEWVLFLNPFSHFLSIIREPLLGHDISQAHWTVAILACMVVMPVTLVVLSSTKRKIWYCL